MLEVVLEQGRVEGAKIIKISTEWIQNRMENLCFWGVENGLASGSVKMVEKGGLIILKGCRPGPREGDKGDG